MTPLPCAPTPIGEQSPADGFITEAAMSKPDAGFDYDRYRQLLAEATDESKRLAFINLLVDEKAKDSLALQSLRVRLAELGLTRSSTDLPNGTDLPTATNLPNGADLPNETDLPK
jgi:hypothetical protein